jgi:hypothetical protein
MWRRSDNAEGGVAAKKAQEERRREDLDFQPFAPFCG